MIKKIIFCSIVSLLLFIDLDVFAQEKEGYPSFSKETIKYENNISSGWQEIEGKYYYYDSTIGDYVSGWQEIDGLRYYFDPITKERYQGIHNIDGKDYFFGITKGYLMYGFIGYNGDYYYSNSEGILQTGMLEVNGNYYYFDKNSNYKALSGWQTIDGLRYYFDPVTKIRYQGIHQVEGKNYFFGVTK